MLRAEAAEYVGITVKQLDGYSNRYTLTTIHRWNGYSCTSYFRIKDLDKLKVRIQQRQVKRDLQNSTSRSIRSISPVEDTLRSNLQEMVNRHCY